MISLHLILERTRQSLGGDGERRYPEELLLEAVRQALEEYSRAWSQVRTAIITLVRDGREHSLGALEGLLGVARVRYPYADETVLPLLSEYHLYWLEGFPMLHLGGARLPQAGDRMQVDYTTRHTLEGLDGAPSGSVHPDHAGLLVNGVAGHAALMRAADITEAHGSRAGDARAVWLLGRGRLEVFRSGLRLLSKESAPPYPLDAWNGHGWRLDRLDGRER